MAEKKFKCDWCEEESNGSLRFEVSITDDEDCCIIKSEEKEHHGFACPDCISAWFAECPETIRVMNLKKVPMEA